MEYSEEDFLQLSGVQHFAFCKRQWALIHIEQAWNDNLLTTQGNIMHERAHDEEIREHRGDTLIVRGLKVHSRKLGLSGICDVVEFHRSEQGHPLYGEMGLWNPVPVEYKRGKSKTNDEDRLQLCSQAICLEEMLSVDIPLGFLFYGETKSRERVDLDTFLREKVVSIVHEMHQLYEKKHTPKAKVFSGCNSCSLAEICVPRLFKRNSVDQYIARALKE